MGDGRRSNLKERKGLPGNFIGQLESNKAVIGGRRGGGECGIREEATMEGEMMMVVVVECYKGGGGGG